MNLPERSTSSLWFGATLALAGAYFGALFLIGTHHLPFSSDGTINIGLVPWLASIVFVGIAGAVLSTWALRRRMISGTNLGNLSLLGITTVGSLVLADTAYSIYLNSGTLRESSNARRFDENVWVGELYPELYFPTERNFRLHKPGVTMSGSPFGGFYTASMLNSPTLVESVLEKHPVTIRVNALGFRESAELSQAEIFALGDSFTFGWGVDESESWPELLETSLNAEVYNLGIHDASPRQEIELLKYVLAEHGQEVSIRQILWMFYEGNDLEDDYSERSQRRDGPVRTSLSSGTLIEPVRSFMLTMRDQSIIDRLRRGRLRLGTAEPEPDSPYLVDDVRLDNPLYHSDRFGPRLFYGQYIDRVSEPASYVENHENRPDLEAVLREMRSLADQLGFDVTVILAPTASRLYASHFSGFPEISETPHFLELVAELSETVGFDTVDLRELLTPYAETELLYFRDDDHFNHRGNALAAELIEREVFQKGRSEAGAL